MCFIRLHLNWNHSTSMNIAFNTNYIAPKLWMVI